jgi:hypothetical protein
LPLSPSFFVGGADGHLWRNYWKQAAEEWVWEDHGTPPGTALAIKCLGTPGALFNSPDAGLKFMMSTDDGGIFERYWDAASSSWGWTNHGTPPGTYSLSVPCCPLDSPATGIKFFLVGADGHMWENYWSQGNRQWLWTDHGVPATGLVAAPAGGAVSNFNYFLDDDGAALMDLSATVTFDVEFTSSANGYSFQLNCYSTEGAKITTEWQQFVIYASPDSTQLWARIDTWSGTAATDELNRIDVALANLPSQSIPAGYAFVIALTYADDGSGTVTGATYTVTDNMGKSLGTATIAIVGQNLRTTGKPATDANLAPIAALQYNIGGDYGGATATLEGTAGTITYSASNALAPATTEPNYTDFNDGTEENANLVFAGLPNCACPVISQSFQAVTGEPGAGTPEPQKRPRAHVLPPPDALSRGGHALPPPDALSRGEHEPPS